MGQLPRFASALTQALRAGEVGLALTDGRDFFADPLDESKQQELGERFIRLPFCALTPVQLQEGVKRLSSRIS